MINKRHYFDIKVNNQTKVADIYIYGVIGYGWYSEGSREAFEFLKEFKQAEKDSTRINIHINSPGGVVEEGLPIFNVINSSKIETHSYIDGIAYSMAAVIALAADNVHIAPNGLFLLHNASGWAAGNAKDFRLTADDLDKYDTSLISSITARTGLTEDQIREKWFDYEDHLFTAQEALDAKLVDDITTDKADLPDDIQDWDLKKVQDFFSKDMDAIDSQNFFNQIFLKVKAALKTNSDTNNNLTMKDLNKIADALGLTIEDLTVDNLIAAITDNQTSIDTVTAERDTAVADLATANQTITDNTTNIDALGEDVSAAEGFTAKVAVIKTKLAAKPGSGPTVVVDPKDGGKKDEVDWDAMNELEHNKAADQLI